MGAAGLLLGGLVVDVGAARPTAAHAATPEYVCDKTREGNKGKGFGLVNCTAHDGAPEQGPIRGAFLIDSRGDGPTFVCRDLSPDGYPSGNAQLPRRIFGFFCETV